MRTLPATCLVVAVAVLAAGCNPTCQSTCRRFYEPEQCDAGPDAIPTEEAIAQCQDVCEDALATPGEAPVATDSRFNPQTPARPTASPQIANEKEAAAWMDCVWSFDDDECASKLDQQLCVRVF